MEGTSPDPADRTKLEDLRDHAWKHLTFHAEQRIKTFNFYVLFATIVTGGLLAFLKEAKHPWIGTFPAAMLMFISFVFWKLDKRSRELLDFSRSAMRGIERHFNTGTDADECAKIFIKSDAFIVAAENAEMEKRKETCIWCSPCELWNLHFTYSRAFNSIFVLVSLLSVLGIAGMIVLSVLPETPPPVAPAPTQQFFIGNQPVTPATSRQP
jgi:hypothetical protein